MTYTLVILKDGNPFCKIILTEENLSVLESMGTMVMIAAKFPESEGYTRTLWF